jgi:hypothetical protein
MSSSSIYRVLDQFDLDNDDFDDVPSAPAALLAVLRTGARFATTARTAP